MTVFSALPSEAEAGTPAQWQGISRVIGPGFLKMPVLTIGMLGLQIIWSVEMSYASPYLLSLGMSKSLMSIVFLAGPLSGLIVQPVIGILSDRSHSRFGRRRPYIFFGALISFGAMYLLGFTREFASVVTKKGSTANNALTVGLAILSIYCIDFSINAVQAMDRALLVDILPVSEQERGNAWAGRMFGVGSVFGFFVGNVDLKSSFSLFGRTQLEILCVITSCILILTHLITIFHVKERVLVRSTDRNGTKPSLWRAVKDIWVNFRALPGTIKRICLIQLFAWIGWFPVLFWTSLYIGELHRRNSPIPGTDEARAALNSEATRLGSRAMLCNALASLFASIVCPFFVSNADKSGEWKGDQNEYESGRIGDLKRKWARRPTCHLASMWTVSHGAFAVCMCSTFFISNVSAATVVMTLTGFSWAITQWAPFALIAEAIHTGSFDSSSPYVLGDADDDSDDEDGNIPLRETRPARGSDEVSPGNTEESRRLISRAKEEENENVDGDEIEQRKTSPSKRVHFGASEPDSPTRGAIVPAPGRLGSNFDAQQSRVDLYSQAEETLHVNSRPDNHGVEDDGIVGTATQGPIRSGHEKSIEDNAGIVLGIHNVFVVIPQFIITGLSSIIFAFMDPEKSVLTSHGTSPHPGSLSGDQAGIIPSHHDPLAARCTLQLRAAERAGAGGPDSVGIIFRIGGVSAAVACVLCFHLARELKKR